MLTARTLRLRTSFRAACRQSARPQSFQLARPLGQRGYASASHGKPSSDMPWLLASVGFTAVGGLYLWSAQKPSRTGGHGAHGKEHESHETHEESAEDSTNSTSKNKASSSESDKSEDSDDSSSSGEDTPPPSPSSTDGQSKELDDSHENQAGKLTDKPASKRVDPTQK